ncbi:hypothetical protein FRC03_004685 [Tulasnella sp. 419]|nr:hypothetical protein FRC03_004685 [Tulasnella sp. 419]
MPPQTCNRGKLVVPSDSESNGEEQHQIPDVCASVCKPKPVGLNLSKQQLVRLLKEQIVELVSQLQQSNNNSKQKTSQKVQENKAAETHAAKVAVAVSKAWQGKSRPTSKPNSEPELRSPPTRRPTLQIGWMMPAIPEGNKGKNGQHSGQHRGTPVGWDQEEEEEDSFSSSEQPHDAPSHQKLKASSKALQSKKNAGSITDESEDEELDDQQGTRASIENVRGRGRGKGSSGPTSVGDDPSDDISLQPDIPPPSQPRSQPKLRRRTAINDESKDIFFRKPVTKQKSSNVQRQEMDGSDSDPHGVEDLFGP